MQAGVFARLWDEALSDYNDLIGLMFSWMALDSSLHKAPLGEKKTSPNPTNCAKGGLKHRLLTDARGIPGGLVLDGANQHDVKLIESTLASLLPLAKAARQAHRVDGGEQGLCLDAGYSSKWVRETVVTLGYTAYIRPRGEEVQTKKADQKARRWVVKCTHSWFNHFCHLPIHWAKKAENYLATLHLAWVRIT